MTPELTRASNPLPFWATQPREGFTAYTEKYELPRMQQSREARQVNTTTMIVGLLDKRKGAQ